MSSSSPAPVRPSCPGNCLHCSSIVSGRKGSVPCIHYPRHSAHIRYSPFRVSTKVELEPFSFPGRPPRHGHRSPTVCSVGSPDGLGVVPLIWPRRAGAKGHFCFIFEEVRARVRRRSKRMSSYLGRGLAANDTLDIILSIVEKSHAGPSNPHVGNINKHACGSSCRWSINFPSVSFARHQLGLGRGLDLHRTARSQTLVFHGRREMISRSAYSMSLYLNLLANLVHKLSLRLLVGRGTSRRFTKGWSQPETYHRRSNENGPCALGGMHRILLSSPQCYKNSIFQRPR